MREVLHQNSIAKDAEILVFTTTGYQRAVKGTNGFVCMVARSWSAGFGDPNFWNPRVRAPICYNAVAAQSQVPETIKRTQVALAGGSRVPNSRSAQSGDQKRRAAGRESRILVVHDVQRDLFQS